MIQRTLIAYVRREIRKSAFSRHQNTRAKRAELLEMARETRAHFPTKHTGTRAWWAETIRRLRASKSYRDTKKTIAVKDLLAVKGRSMHYRK